MCRLGGHRHSHEAAKGEEPVGDLAEWRGSIALEAAATGRSVVAATVRCAPTLSARLMRASQMALVRRWRTALRHSGPLKPLRHALEAACGVLRPKDERSNKSLDPLRRSRACASADRTTSERGCFLHAKKLSCHDRVREREVAVAVRMHARDLGVRDPVLLLLPGNLAAK